MEALGLGMPGPISFREIKVHEQGTEQIKKPGEVSMRKLAYLNKPSKPELPVMFVGAIVATLHGITLPVFGGISAFGSASILGGPFVMALVASDNIIIASSLSLLAGLGELLPPTAMSATFASGVVGEEKYIKITKEALIPLIVSMIYAMIFILFISNVWRAA